MQQQALSLASLSPHIVRDNSAFGKQLAIACDTYESTLPSTVNNNSYQVVHPIQVDGIARCIEET